MDLNAAHTRKTALILSLAANLGFLGYFKYTNFPLGTHYDIVPPLGTASTPSSSASLYAVDVYRGQQTAIRNPPDYALFSIAFFPQLVAGPHRPSPWDFFRDLLHLVGAHR